MTAPTSAQALLDRINGGSTKLGDLRVLAKEIKQDHGLAMALWASGAFLPRMLATMIMDKKLLTQDRINALDKDLNTHPPKERLQLIDRLMADQLAKDKKTIALLCSWADSPSPLQRRIFWYYQGRLRWVGQTPPPNTEHLLALIEARIQGERPEVQWAMNFTAAQIGIFQPEYRTRCIALGERTGLYKDEVVGRNCTPNYLPLYIAAQVAKVKG